LEKSHEKTIEINEKWIEELGELENEEYQYSYNYTYSYKYQYNYINDAPEDRIMTTYIFANLFITNWKYTIQLTK